MEGYKVKRSLNPETIKREFVKTKRRYTNRITRKALKDRVRINGVSDYLYPFYQHFVKAHYGIVKLPQN
jgi:hypothetical protein